MANQFEPFVNIDTVAEFLDVSTKTVRRLVFRPENPSPPSRWSAGTVALSTL